MKKELFDELVESVKESGAILRGEMEPSRVFIAPGIEKSKLRILITGAAGFLGSHLVEHLLVNTDWDIVGLVRLGRVGDLQRLTSIRDWDKHKDRVHIVWHDLRSPLNPTVRAAIGPLDYIIHAAGETHVDRSIVDATPFVLSNVLGTSNMLEFARTVPGLRWFCQISTDEVLGPAPIGVSFSEDARYNPTNPYAASKGAAECLVLAAVNSHRELHAFVVRLMNLVGEKQNGEKFVPLVIRNVLNGDVVTIHGDSTKTISGSRHYLHCRNAADGLLFLLEHASNREIYHIAGEREISNLSLAKLIADIIGLPLKWEMVDFHGFRPGHDLRYSLDSSKIRLLGWRQPKSLEESITKLVQWTLRNPSWLIV